MNETIKHSVNLLMSLKQDEIFSKVCGRENYVIKLFDGKVCWYGTKGQWLKNCCHSYLLSEAVRYNVFKYTYKKDWLEMLRKLGVNI